jgi:hypothetical protein
MAVVRYFADHQLNRAIPGFDTEPLRYTPAPGAGAGGVTEFLIAFYRASRALHQTQCGANVASQRLSAGVFGKIILLDQFGKVQYVAILFG